MVCKLLKSLYGLRHASREWHSKLGTSLLSRGYSISKNDTSLFYKSTGSSILYLAVYVDDILVIGNDLSEVTSIKAYLDSTFKIKGLGPLHYFLGLEFISTPDGMILSQRKFASDLIRGFLPPDSTTVISPLDLNVKLLPHTGTSLTDSTQYRKLAGKLMLDIIDDY